MLQDGQNFFEYVKCMYQNCSFVFNGLCLNLEVSHLGMIPNSLTCHPTNACPIVTSRPLSPSQTLLPTLVLNYTKHSTIHTEIVWESSSKVCGNLPLLDSTMADLILSVRWRLDLSKLLTLYVMMRAFYNVFCFAIWNFKCS